MRPTMGLQETSTCWLWSLLATRLLPRTIWGAQSDGVQSLSSESFPQKTFVMVQILSVASPRRGAENRAARAKHGEKRNVGTICHVDIMPTIQDRLHPVASATRDICGRVCVTPTAGCGLQATEQPNGRSASLKWPRQWRRLQALPPITIAMLQAGATCSPTKGHT